MYPPGGRPKSQSPNHPNSKPWDGRSEHLQQLPVSLICARTYASDLGLTFPQHGTFIEQSHCHVLCYKEKVQYGTANDRKIVGGKNGRCKILVKCMVIYLRLDQVCLPIIRLFL